MKRGPKLDRRRTENGQAGGKPPKKTLYTIGSKNTKQKLGKWWGGTLVGEERNSKRNSNKQRGKKRVKERASKNDYQKSPICPAVPREITGQPGCDCKNDLKISC